MDQIKTSCKGCVFAEYLDVNGKRVQYDCYLDKIKKINPEENFESSETESWFVSNRFCNTYRPEQWIIDFCNNNLDIAKQVVVQEIKPRLSIVIDFDDNMDTFTKNLEIINSQEESRKFVTVINDKIEYNVEMINKLHDLYLNKKIVEYNVLMPISRDNIYNNIDDALGFCKNGWIIFIQKGELIPDSLTSIIDKRVNYDMKRLVYAPKKDSQSFVIQSAIYKLLNGNKPKILQDGSIDDKTFLERVSELKSEDPDCLTTWEELFYE